MLLLPPAPQASQEESWLLRFSPREGIFAFATRLSPVLYLIRYGQGFSPREGIFAFATDPHADPFGQHRGVRFSPREGIFAFATGRRRWRCLGLRGYAVSVPVRGFLLLLPSVMVEEEEFQPRFSPREGIFAFATGHPKRWMTTYTWPTASFSPREGIFAFATEAALTNALTAATFQSP